MEVHALGQLAGEAVGGVAARIEELHTGVAGRAFEGVGLIAAGPAQAADLVPAYKAAPVVYSSWTGVYAGVQAGYKWSDMNWNTTCLGLTDTFCPLRNDAGTDSTLIANACVVVSLDMA